MATIKGKLKQKTSTGSDILHPETEADAVLYTNAGYDPNIENVQDALDKIISAGVGVRAVQNGSGTSLVEDSVATVTPTNIGAVPKERKVNNKELSANISLDYSDVGAIPASDKGAASGVATLDSGSKIPVAQIPDVVMGQLVYGGTVTGVGVATLSTNAKTKLGTSSSSITLTNNTTATTGYAANEGIFYIVSSDGNFASLGLKVGDWLIATGSSWKKIDNTDAVTSVNGDIGPITLNANNLPYESSTDTKTIKSVVDGKQDALDGQPEYDKKGTTTKVPQITTNGLGQVTKIEEKAIAFPDITIGSASSSGNAITAIAVDSSNKHKINVTKGTFLTAHQSLDAYPQKAVDETITGSWTFQADSMATANAKFKTTVSGTEYSSSFYGGTLQLEGPWNSTYRSRTRYHDTKIEFNAFAGSTPAVVKTLTFDNAQSGTILTTGDIGAGNGEGLAKVSDVTGKADKVSMTAGTYSAVAVNSQGIVTSGGQVWKCITSATPSSDKNLDNLATGGLYFIEDGVTLS